MRYLIAAALVLTACSPATAPATDAGPQDAQLALDGSTWQRCPCEPTCADGTATPVCPGSCTIGGVPCVAVCAAAPFNTQGVECLSLTGSGTCRESGAATIECWANVTR